MSDLCGRSYFHGLAQLVLNVHTQVVLIHFIIFERTLFLIISGRQHRGCLFRTARSCNLMALNKPCMKHLIYPVSPLTVLNGLPFLHSEKFLVIGGRIPLTASTSSFTTHLHIVFPTQHIRILRPPVYTKITIIRKLCFTLRTFLGGDNDYPISTLRTINCRRRSIFQHFDRFNISRSNIREITSLHTINDKQRSIGNIVTKLIFHIGQ